MTKVPDNVGFIQQQSTDKIDDLSIVNRGFCLQVCTKPNEQQNNIYLLDYRISLQITLNFTNLVPI